MPDLEIAIDAGSPEPVYEQIVHQIHAAVDAGLLQPGTPLPTVRQLADDLAINRNTVARAYKLLEDHGVVRTGGRRGTVVHHRAAEEVTRIKEREAERAIRELIDRLKSIGMDGRAISRAVTAALHAGRSGRSGR